MTRALRLNIEKLASWMAEPHAQEDPERLRQAGRLCVLLPASAQAVESSKEVPSRWQTIFGYDHQLLLLVDEFHANRPTPFTMSLESPTNIEGDRRRYWVADALRPLSLHPLGDYDIKRRRRLLTLSQRLALGRFLVVLARDADARARVLNGWAVEVRSHERVCHLLHSNRSHRLRPLGPVQTDAQFAVAEWSAEAESKGLHADDITLHVVQASQILWEDQSKWAAEVPADGIFRGPAKAD